MMKKIRRSLFETNSSTMHSLTFAYGMEKEDLKKIIGSDTLKFGTRNPDEIDKANEKTRKNWATNIDKSVSWQDRADILFWRLLRYSNGAGFFIIVQHKIKEIFEKRGIKVEFLIEPNIDYIIENYEYSREGDNISDEFFSYDNPEFEEQIINFIFSPYILEYTYADDCISDEEYEGLQKDFNELMLEFPKDAVGFQVTDR